MKLYLVKDVVHEFEGRFGSCTPNSLKCFDNKEAEVEVGEHGNNDKDKVSKEERLRILVNKLAELGQNEDWILRVSVYIYEASIGGGMLSAKMGIRLEGTILKTIHDLLDIGDEGKLKIQLFAVANACSKDNRSLLSHPTDMEVKVFEFTKIKIPLHGQNEGTEHLYQALGIEVPLGLRVFISGNDVHLWNWVFKTTIKIDVSDFVPLDGLLPEQSEVARSLWSRRKYCDLEVIAGDKSCTKAHKDILAVHSSVFAAKFETKLEEGPKNELHLPEMSKDGVEALLQFLYCGDVKKPMTHSNIALELYQAGHKYDIPCLEKAMSVILMEKSNQWYDVDVAFRLFIFARLREDLDLKWKILDVLTEKMWDLRKSEMFHELFPNDTAKDLFLLSLWRQSEISE